MSRAKEGLLSFLGTANAAGQLAAAQSKKTKLTSVDLPSAYHALGKIVVASGRYAEQFPSEHQQIAKLDEQIAAYSERTAAAGTEMKHKFKAGADNVKKAGLLKMAAFQRSSVLKSLGQNAFDAGIGDPDFVEAINKIQEIQIKVEVTNDEISRLSELDKGKLVTPVRLLIVAGALCAFLFLAVALPLTSRSTGKSSARSADSSWPDLILSEHQTPSRISRTREYKIGYDQGASFGSEMAQQLYLIGHGMGRYGILDHVNDLSILEDDPIYETVEFKVGYADGMEYGLGKRFWPELDKNDFRWQLNRGE